MIDPVRVLVNGRAARSCGDIAIPVDDIVVEGVRSFFAQRLELLDESSLRIELNITSNPSPGAVLVDGEVPDRTRWFTPRSTEDLRERKTVLANDTSLGTGWSPLNDFEAFVRELSDLLSGPSTFRQENAWCGSDVKVMGYDSGETSEFVVCVPQKSLQVSNRARYLENKALTAYTCEQLAEERLPDRKVTFKVNVRDVPEKDELYLTYTGSSIESGDEGVVGRGNRVNGLITPMRPMNLEGANGKNPVYHVGKLYNLAASRLAALLAELTGDYAEVHLVSASGQRLDRPWRVHVRLCSGVADLGKVQSTILDVLDNFSVLTDELVHAGVELS
jgi:S-adenosylmethionine synthetase